MLGRSSRNQSKGCVAAEDNGWYDSAVMSREHAKIIANLENQVSLAPFCSVHAADPFKTVEIKDLGSLHGTYFITQRTATGQMEEKLDSGERRQLVDGDELKLGASVYRSNVCFQPNILKVGINWYGQAHLPSIQMSC